MLCSRDLGGILFHASRFCGGVRIERHIHTTGYFCLLVGGPLWERVGARTWKHGPLTLLAHPPEEAHSESAFLADHFISFWPGSRHLDAKLGLLRVHLRPFGKLPLHRAPS